MAAPADAGPPLAERRTRLAVRRSFLAAERTLMAWVRTAPSMISFGFTTAKVFEYLETERKLTVGRSWAPATLGLALIAIGIAALVVAVIQHRQTVGGLREAGLPPTWRLALTVATLLATLGIFAFGSLALEL
jgi:putative membrane protein